jgi:hypothetical protein
MGQLLVSDSDNVHGDWFDTLEDMGESFLFRLGRYRPGMDEPTWFFLPHQSFDGLGGLAHILRTTQNTNLKLPELSADDRPSALARWMAALRLLFRHVIRPRPWRLESCEKNEPGKGVFAWTLFSSTDTLALRAAARAHGVSLNAWLLWGLAESCLQHLAPGRRGAAWIVPINMRGAVASQRDTANLASILDIAFPLPATPSAVDAALRGERRKRAHFGAWQLLQIVGRLHPRLRRAVVRREAQVPKHGSFSNLGQLFPDAPPDSGAPEWWMAFNPVIRSRPVGMACLTWQSRMSVTLHLHPVLGCSEAEARRWIAVWRSLVLRATDEASPGGHIGSGCNDGGEPSQRGSRR